MAKTETQFWLAELDQYGNAKLLDGPHTDADGAEQALTILRKLNCEITEGRIFAIAEVHLSTPTGDHTPINQKAIDILNGK